MASVKRLLKQGYLSPTYLHHREIRQKVMDLKKSGLSNGKAVREASKLLGVTVQYVYRVLKQLKL